MAKIEVENVRATLKLEGWWWDEFYKKSPETGEDVLFKTSPITKNLITIRAGFLLAGLLANEASFTGGILQHAIGIGDPAWDTAMVQPNYADTTLYDEVARLAPDSISYTDASGSPVVGLSNWIQIKTTFDYLSPANGQYIREQGLFGGDADLTLNTGQMIDAIRHSRIYKDSTFKWIRYIRLGL